MNKMYNVFKHMALHLSVELFILINTYILTHSNSNEFHDQDHMYHIYFLSYARGQQL